MSSKIDGLPGNRPVGGPQKPQPARVSGNSVSGGPAPPGADSVSLTEGAKLLGRVEELIRDFPEVDQERVNTIKQAISEGRYTVDASRVAEQVLLLEQDLRGQES